MPDLLDTQQQQMVETTTLLGGSATFTSTGRDCITFRKFGVSVFLQRGAANTNVDIIVEDSLDDVTYRTVESVNALLTPVATIVNFNRIYDSTRRFIRTRLVNNTANALAATEVVSTRKPF
jgi:hypothetical protein